MLVSYKWLKELVDVDVTTAELAEKMSTTGIEVEGVETPAEGLSKLVVGHIVSCEDVPDTHLHLCQVDTGDDELRQVVCGAPNVKTGINVIVAVPGARIADNYKIKKGKIRGMESLGMICSLQELGLSESIIPKEFSDGIQILPEGAIPGDSIFSYLDLDDEIIELSITPNRSDALSMRGVAHEVAAIYGKKVHFEEKNLIEEAERAADKISVVIESDKVLSYSARIVKNVTVAPSPQWLQNKLMNAGIRPINNVVDVTNYVLLTYGQPMHAFDFDKFDGTTIVARNSENGEKLITLDGEERDLIADDLVIAVNDQPVALAGVMGGQSTEIDSSSKTVVLEAAVFNGTSIRKTSGRLNLRSESSSRFEKGINYDTVSEAMDFAAAMLQELAGGQVLSGQVTEGVLPTEPVEVSTTLGYVNTRLGTELTYTDIEEVFEKLGFAISGSEVKFTVLVPRRRWDIAIQADLVEEIARIYGYEKLPTTLPEAGATAGELTSMQRLRRRVRTVAEGAGLSEIITYALTTPEKAVQFSTQPTNITELMWPMTVDRSALRQNVVSGMLDTIAYNVARKNSNLAVYEIGKVFEQTGNPKEDLPTEVETFTFALTGLVEEKDFQTKAKPVDFFYAKGIVEALFIKLKLDVTFVAQKGLASMHPGRTATILLDGKEIGFVGQVHPQTAKQYDIPETYVAEINLSTIESQMNQALIFEDITKYPSVSRDIALLLAESVSHHDIVSAIESSGVKRLTAIKLFDVYAGNNIAEGYKSMAYSLTFQNPNDNLTDEEVAKYMEKITKSLVEKVNAEIR
ncbi:TPA: phenylalanine--tRNA ligase subunit beta [Streptococcus agalactiae]|uniref:phenylalanine--tRNA ligase subunit beta n=3 Tax=Streptococcus agalactiae TaxID=1311 RepID=UPI000332E668|nr:phenylalanine--tRNA ligase subunit beta [Streptococcus agalactiae]CCW42032.1 Phenylalanyl-tRNA synthetase beta chain [Streptococcus agalactiae ILRI112]OTG46036.1 phenylalanine--tRNA ligase subunit beta [Streptococcus agalactiae]OTG47099.1 phenylalanine--tRNA ligase subunit beta [Streptococcus agalactiae]OTG52591.1 phenylalanine--tRNA ligase subunit beta [Streptococcus agalactiae]OTG52845.1 phenylalanine--tRNA ligase subunit beta [Streptococcus agalactiae]